MILFGERKVIKMDLTPENAAYMNIFSRNVCFINGEKNWLIKRAIWSKSFIFCENSFQFITNVCIGQKLAY